MKKLKLIFIILVGLGLTVKAQQAISLSDCYEGARAVHPSAGEKQIQATLWQLEDKNLASSWYPEISAGANALYNSSVTDLSEALAAIPIPGLSDNLEGMPHDQYKLTLDISQLIWDGGTLRNKRRLEEAVHLVKDQEVEVELYKVKERVNTAFFGLILLKRQKDLLSTYLELVENRSGSVKSAIENGMMLPGDLETVLAEKIRLQQQLKEAEIKIVSLYSVLSDITGLEINAESEFILPEISLNREEALRRPELLNFDYMIKQLEASESLVKSSRMPKAFGFATLGYGSPPGNDFFTDEFGTYAVVGAGISWKIFDWDNSRRNRQKIDLNKDLINNRKTDLEESLSRALTNKYAEIKAFESMLETDIDLIELRKSITAASESRFRNGTITSTEYMSIMNLEKEAILTHNIHQVNYIKSQVEYLSIAGNEIN